MKALPILLITLMNMIALTFILSSYIIFSIHYYIKRKKSIRKLNRRNSNTRLINKPLTTYLIFAHIAYDIFTTHIDSFTNISNLILILFKIKTIK